jgi:hypothetical protein
VAFNGESANWLRAQQYIFCPALAYRLPRPKALAVPGFEKNIKANARTAFWFVLVSLQSLAEKNSLASPTNRSAREHSSH